MSQLASFGLLFSVFLTVYIGFACLALAQGRHWRDLLGPEWPGASPPRVVLRGAGSALISVGFALALLRDGLSFGALLWGTVISLSAVAVVATLAVQASWLKLLARTIASATSSRHSAPGRPPL